MSVLRDRISDERPPAWTSISRGTRVRVFVALPVFVEGKVAGAVVLSRTARNIFETLWGKRRPILYSGALVFAVVLAVVLATSLLVTRPVHAVICQTERASRGEAGAVTPLARPGTREVAQLSTAVAHMARTLEERARYIRDFTSQVSHEFKTPLTAMRGAVELLRDHGDAMSAEERDRFLSNLQEDAERLARLVRRLLDLAHADMMGSGSGEAAVRAVVEPVVARFRSEGLDVSLEACEEDVSVGMGEESLRSVVENLLGNARQHAGEAARVVVRIEAGDPVRMTVADDGPGIAPSNAGRIFEPFFTTARSAGGTGLGLSVVRSTVEACGGALRLRPSSRGAVFEVELPWRRP